MRTADAVVEHKPLVILLETALEVDHFPLSPREAEYANSMVSRYREVESILLNCRHESK